MVVGLSLAVRAIPGGGVGTEQDSCCGIGTTIVVVAANSGDDATGGDDGDTETVSLFLIGVENKDLVE